MSTTTSADAQLAALVRLRWTMVREGRARAGLTALLGAATLLVLGALVAGLVIELDVETRDNVVLLSPTVLAAFGVLAFAAPLAAGGGNELYPPDQLVAFPVSARTQYHASLVLAPLNLAWFTQVALILGVTTFVFDDLTPKLLLGLLTVVLYLAWMTLLGQAVAWGVVGVRATRRGRRAVWGLAAVLLAGAAVVALVVGVTRVLDRLPTQTVMVAAAQGNTQPGRLWVTVTLALLVAAALTWGAGLTTSGWALRRGGDTGRAESDRVRRRPDPGGELATLVATDRASVWRSTALRRGVLVLALLPAAIVALAGLEWPSLVLMPGLVAAGAGLLFGVNAFALDAGGATWLASQPVAPTTVFWAKTRVLVEICVLSVGASLAAGALRAPAAPTAGEAAAALGAAVAAVVTVTATCMRLSVRQPHRAELRGSRDTPAPPGTMAVYSLRLAVSTTLLGLLFSGFALSGGWQGPTLLAFVFLALGVRRLLVSAREYADPAVRARVTATVAAG